MISRLMAAAAAGILVTLTVAAPALAHGADAPVATDYRTHVTTVTPATPGLTLRAIEAGARLELTNRTGRTIEVLGYSGEPYLEVRPDGVYENVHSPATYLNQTLAGGIPPASADPLAPPSWRRIDTKPVARWHDQRTYWTEVSAPPQVSADPSREHRVRDWVVPLRDGLTPIEVHGTLDWLPPPDPALWWAVSLLGAFAVAALGLLPVESGAGRMANGALAAVSAVGGLAALTFAVAREIDAGSSGVGEFLQGLLGGQIWPVLAGLGALAAAGYALARRPAADFALALTGACLALFAGVTNAAVLSRSVVPIPGPATWGRVTIAVVIAIGAGVAAAGALRLRAATRSVAMSVPPAASPQQPKAQPPVAT